MPNNYLHQVPERVRMYEPVREALPPDVVELLRKTGLVYVSGLPSIRTEPPTYYGQNEHVAEVPFVVTSASVMELPPRTSTGEPLPISTNITPEFLGRYAVLNGFDPTTQVDYVFPVREETQFSIRPR